jgi:hypothetical protein
MVKKGETSGRCTEVHVLSGVSIYTDFILRSETPLFRSNGFFEFAVAYRTGDRKPDLVAFRKKHTEFSMMEVQVVSQQD